MTVDLSRLQSLAEAARVMADVPDDIGGGGFESSLTKGRDSARRAFIAAADPVTVLALIQVARELDCLVGMLEDDGCLERPEDLDDARAALSVLTDEGAT